MATYEIEPTTKDVEVSLEWFRKAAQGDVDGRFKILLDSLQSKHARWQKCLCGGKYGMYDDDRRIKRLSIERIDDKTVIPQIMVTVIILGEDDDDDNT